MGHECLPNDLLHLRDQPGQRTAQQRLCLSSAVGGYQPRYHPCPPPCSWGSSQTAVFLQGKGREDKDEGEPGGCSCALSHCQLCSAVPLPQGLDSPATRPATKGSTFFRTKHLAGLGAPCTSLSPQPPVHSKITLLTSSHIPPVLWSFEGVRRSLYPPTGWFLATGLLLPQMSWMRAAKDASLPAASMLSSEWEAETEETEAPFTSQQQCKEPCEKNHRYLDQLHMPLCNGC